MDKKENNNKQLDSKKDNLENKGRRDILKKTLTGVAGGAAAMMLGETLKPNDAHAASRDFCDFAYRITVPDGTHNDPAGRLGNRFMTIIGRVAGNNPESVEAVTETLYNFFLDNNYEVSKKQCRQILEFHNKFSLYLKDPRETLGTGGTGGARNY